MEGRADETPAGADPSAKRKRVKEQPESYEALATVALSRARSLLKRAEPGSPADPMVDFMLQSAHVLATLELASAIRGATGQSQS
jgi:hypothetical protein